MRIVNHREFLALSPSTVFAKYEPTGTFGSICIKGETISNDFYYDDLIAPDYDDSNQMLKAFDYAEKDPTANVAMSSNEGGRDGCFDDGQQYCIFAPAEVQGMIAALQATQSLNHTPPFLPGDRTPFHYQG